MPISLPQEMKDLTNLGTAQWSTMMKAKYIGRNIKPDNLLACLEHCFV